MSENIVVFSNEGLGMEICGYKDARGHLWFRSSDVSRLLGHTSQPSHIVDRHVAPSNRGRVEELIGDRTFNVVSLPRSAVVVNKRGVGEIIDKFASGNTRAVEWLRNEVIGTLNPDILFDMKTPATFVMTTEFNLHARVVKFIRTHVENPMIIAGLGELQREPRDRISSKAKGYQKGQPDLILLNPMDDYKGICIEFKTPKGMGKLSVPQITQLNKLHDMGYKCIVSNDYDKILIELIHYFSI